MIGTYLYAGQGLGNQLWSYYALRLIAKKLSLPFALFGTEYFKGSSFISFDPGAAIIAPKRLGPNSTLFDPFQNYFSEQQIVHVGEYCDVRPYDSRCLSLLPNTLIDGYFQSEKLVRVVDHNIFDFFSIRDINELSFLSDDKICVLNIRGGEYKKNKRLTLHKKYWENAMSYMQGNRGVDQFLIVTDDPEYAHKLFPKIEILEQDMHHDFIALSKVKNIILSNSSFAYFPLRFNKQSPHIIAPKYWARHNVSDGYWACRSNIYKDYLYLDRAGQIMDSDACEHEADKFIQQNKNAFSYKYHTYAAKHPNRMKSFLRNRFIRYG